MVTVMATAMEKRVTHQKKSKLNQTLE
jgi:hypothetical protein